MSNDNSLWPDLSFDAFKSTQYVLHRGVQMMGKLKLLTPFEPHWANVMLLPTCSGLTTGIIPYKNFAFSVDWDCKENKFIFMSSLGKKTEFILPNTISVSTLYQTFMQHLNKISIELQINPMPQEIPNAISFVEDIVDRHYDYQLAFDWWTIIINTYNVLEKYHAKFTGISPPVGFMWGTFDLRDARYLNIPSDTSKLGFIERNAMDVKQVEAGFWPGNEKYTKPAFFSFTYPKPKGIENSKLQPKSAYWNESLGEFILDYEAVRNSPEPETTLLNFFESGYTAGSTLAEWDPNLVGAGVPK